MRAIPALVGHYRVFALVRNPAHCAALRAMNVTPIPGDLDHRASLNRLAGLANAVLHFAPPSQQAHGREAQPCDPRTRNLLGALSQGTPPRQLIYISTSGVYGDCGGRKISESHPVHPQTARAARRVDAERQIRNWAKRHGINAGILRVPGIYAIDRLPLARLQESPFAIQESEDGYTNHIHADDLARIAIAALRHGRPNRIYHASDDSELKMGDYLDAVADLHHLPRPTRISRADAQKTLSPSLFSFMNESRRLTNARMKQELKVALRYPTVADGLKN
jgi:nucleoside-diphosphate-sugar epimerase